MAKKRAKAKLQKGWLAAGAFVVVAAVVVGVLGAGTSGFRDWSFGKFFPKKTVAEQKQANVILGEQESNGIELCSAAIPVADYAAYGIDPQAVDTVYNLSVTYTPANTTFQKTNYTINFKDPSSTWAEGKNITDYATLNQSEEGSKDAQLTILQPFSEQIIVTARSERNSELYVQTVVDYVCTTLTIDVERQQLDVSDEICQGSHSWSNGTIAPESDGNVTFVLDVGTGVVASFAEAGFEVSQYYEQVLSTVQETEVIMSFSDMVRYIGNYRELSPERKVAYDDVLGQLFGNFQDGDGVGAYKFKYNRVYNGVNYGSGDTGWLGDIEGRNFSYSFEVKAASMTTNHTHIIVG